ncbi:MAG: NGG1p interacting factor NIF3 [Candidatus Omnitrophica bacterium]|nr:NGG1p interacting factor NIF3 [Candidatus Omnitrophota bacterium]HOX53960.1 NGG1p interacting factor NIF3 [Candidatus Omnitrophota bacterium]
MKLGEIYKLFVKEGIASDLRSKNAIQEHLKKQRKYFNSLNKEERNDFDLENLGNPYADTRILYGEPEREIETILIGIDIDVPEILLADRLSSGGKKIDLVISHHPRGVALAGFYDVMGMQADMLAKLGMDIEIARGFLGERMQEVERNVSASNHNRPVDAARMLDIAFMCAHTVADNHVNKYLNEYIQRRKPQTLKDLVKVLRQIPEYRLAAKDKAGPKIIIGKPEDKVGKVSLEMTGGTEGSKEIFGRLSQLGVNTIVGMHLSEEHFKRVKPEHINVVIAGHISSDTIGLNLLLDKLEKKDKFEILSCSGFRRLTR